MDMFNVEEINLMCVYDTSDKSRLIAEMRDSVASALFATRKAALNYALEPLRVIQNARPAFLPVHDVYEPEILEIMQNAIAKLERMTDEEYAEIGFFIADDIDEQE